MDDFIKYLGNGEYINNPPKVANKPGTSKPMRMIWFSAPFTFSQAHAGTDYVSTFRQQYYNEYALAWMRKMGVPVVNAAAMTKTQWENAYDGLHYLRGSNDFWAGCVSHTVFQAILNVAYPTCSTG